MLIVEAPPVVGGGPFRVGVYGARHGSLAWVSLEPVTDAAEGSPWDLNDSMFQSTPSFIDGHATWQAELPVDETLIGQELDICWCFFDDSIPSRIAKTRTVRLTVH